LVSILSVVYLSDTLRGLIYYLINRYELPVYCEYVFKLEKSIFGTIPSVSLQKLLLGDGQFTWFEKVCTALHGTHFIAFLIIGFFLWLKNTGLFVRFKVSFYFLLAIGMSLYALVPTAAPWMASQMFGLMPPLVHFNIELYTMYLPDLTSGFNTNPVAAMPSLHAAFPFLCSLLLWSKYKFKALPFYIYTGLILFTIVYTGDHYVIDIIFGIVIAIISYLMSINILHHRTSDKKRNLKIKHFILRPDIIAGVLILTFSIFATLSIKPKLKEYYVYQFSNLNFVDFINHPEKADSNYKIAIFLGDHYSSQGEQEGPYVFIKRPKS
jgi:membrane-associated phospholipid phosphatase